MEVRIEVKGADDVKSKLKGITLASLQKWTENVQKEARTSARGKLSPEIVEGIRIQAFEIEPKTFEVKANLSREAVPFIIEATKNSLQNMPFGFRNLFQSFLAKSEESLHKRSE